MSVAAALTATVVASSQANAVPPSQSTAERTLAKPGHERWATITRIKNGYYYDAGTQHTRLTVTKVDRGLRYFDRRTDVLRQKPDSCDRKRSDRGLVVVCRVPRDVSPRNPFTVKVFTRLGNDHVDTSALPAAFQLYGLADWGDDVYIGGDGDDFINSSRGHNIAIGGRGDDLVRGGMHRDLVIGGPGNDTMVGLEGVDRMRGGPGDDRIGGHEGDDYIYAGPGEDFVLCSTGFDQVFIERRDRVMADCERVRFV